MSQHLTDASVKRLKVPERGSCIYYDAAVKGLGVRVTAAGARSFILNYRTKVGRERRATLGSAQDWQVTAARARAKDLKKQIDNGGDPLADVEQERAAPTVHDLIDRFEVEHLPKRRAGTQADYKSILTNHVRPHWGRHVKVIDVTTDDIEQLHRKISSAGHKRRANTAVAVLSKMFSLAVRWRMRSDNPCRGIERNSETKRKRYLSAEELARLLAALAAHPSQQAANVFRLLLLTGARRGEVLAMRWADVDVTAGKWVKPGSTTKQKTEHDVPLSAPARQLLAEIAAQQTSKRGLPEFVFPGNGSLGHIVETKRAWRHIAKAAGISDLRIHDLRHSFASELVSGGASLPLIGALLGHSTPSTTARYAHLFDDPLKAAVERVGAVITAAGNGSKPEPPVPSKRGRRRDR